VHLLIELLLSAESLTVVPLQQAAYLLVRSLLSPDNLRSTSAVADAAEQRQRRLVFLDGTLLTSS
jgi:hypothetical protein